MKTEQETNVESLYLGIYKELLSFIFRLTCNRQDSEDILQDTYLILQKNGDSFQGKSTFKTWVYAIAINKAKNHLKVQKRWHINYQDKGEAAHKESTTLMNKLIDVYHAQPDVNFEIKEHINYCFNCTTKTLNIQQQVCLWLKDFYEFTIPEIIQITGLTEGSVKHHLTYARRNLDKIFEKRCAFVNKNGTCHQCSALKGILNPAQIEAQNKIDMQNQSIPQDHQPFLEMRIAMIKDLNPLDSPNSHLHIYMLEQLPDWALETK